jgi:hypothetical protein
LHNPQAGNVSTNLQLIWSLHQGAGLFSEQLAFEKAACRLNLVQNRQMQYNCKPGQTLAAIKIIYPVCHYLACLRP